MGNGENGDFISKSCNVALVRSGNRSFPASSHPQIENSSSFPSSSPVSTPPTPPTPPIVMALAERIVLTPKYPGRKVRLQSQGRELKAALDETKLLLRDHRQQCLRIMDLSTSPVYQPVFIKFWQLFLQLRPQTDFVSGESGRCTLPSPTYLSAMSLIEKALGSALATTDHLAQLQGLETEVSYKRFCYDFVCCLGDGVLDISSERYAACRFEGVLRSVFKACTRVVDLRVELKDVDGRL